MNFLNPAVLLGLIAAAAPLLFHLLSKRRAREVPFPSIRLLEQLKSDRIRLLKLKQLLLLLLRTLIIIAIVMGFARPALRSTFRANARTAAVVIIDGTASMHYIDGGETLFDRAKRRAGDVLTLLGDGDRAAVLVVGAEPVVVQPGMTGDIRMLADQLGTLEPSHAGGNPGAAFTAAMELLAASPAVNREVYYLTDGAVSSLPDSVPVDESVRLYTIALGPEEHRGGVIERLIVEDKVIAPGRELTFRAEGMLGVGSRDTDISFILNGERRGTTRTTPDEMGRFTARFTAIPEDTGRLSVAVRAESGFYESGETARCVVNVPDPARILYVADREDDAVILQQILDAAAVDSSFVSKVRLATDGEGFDGYDVIVLAGVAGLTESSYQSLLGAVIRDGAGLVIIPPSGPLPELYSQRIFRDLFTARTAGQVRMQTIGRTVSAVIDRFDQTHPIMRGISTGEGLELAGVTSYLSLEAPPDARIFARFGDGTIAAADMDCGAGRAVLFTPDMQAVREELVYSGVFIPVFVRTVQYLSDTLPDTGGAVTGTIAGNVFTVPEAVSQVTIRRENEPALHTAFIRRGGSAVLDGFTPAMPGFYSVLADGMEVSRLAVNLPRDEIGFSRAPEHLVRESFRAVSWRPLEDADTFATSVRKDRYGTELAGFFLGAALALLLGEMLISRRA